LDNVKVIEFGASVAVGYAGWLFTSMGATVHRIACPDSDVPPAEMPLRSHLDVGKERIELDPFTPVGRDGFDALLRDGTVLIHGRCDPAIQRAGLAPAEIGGRCPELVVAAISPFGWNSPRRFAPADDLTLQALGGISLGIGAAERAPLKLPGNQTAFQSGLCATMAALAALFGDQGGVLDLAEADIWAGLYSGNDVANAHFNRIRKGRRGHQTYRSPYPRTILPCKDGFFAVQCSVSHQWRGFLKMTAREDLLDAPLFANRIKANDEHGAEADAQFEPWFRAHTKAEILEKCLEMRIPGAPVYTVGEVVAHPHLQQRGFFKSTAVGDRKITVPGLPWRVEQSATASAPAKGPKPRSRARPLAGLRVTDFGWVWAGAVPGHVLADLGAEVIKIESLSRLDYMRQGRPLVGTEKDPEQNPMFHNTNRGKLSFRVDMTNPKGAELLKKLVAESDVVIENFTPGVLDRYGLGWEALQSVRPDLIMCSMSAVGQAGLLRDIRTYATMIAGLSGLDSLVGYSGERVLGSQSSYADPNASLHATVAILEALYSRARTGNGCYIDLSQWEAAVDVMAETVLDYTLNGRVADTPQGLVHPEMAPYGHFPAAGDDAWIAIAVSDDAQWQALIEALDARDLADDPRFANQDGRREHSAVLHDALSIHTAQHDAGALAGILSDAGIPVAPLLHPKDLAEHPHFMQRGLYQLVPHPILPDVPVYRLPWWIDDEPINIPRRCPLLGEHNDHVLRKILGLSDADKRAYADAGVFDA
jgi:crotonobetainyl-CoA:carnitine CoA-transferase CaiB-like acyl-CoA transferase